MTTNPYVRELVYRKQVEHQKRFTSETPRTDRLDGGALLHKRRQEAEARRNEFSLTNPQTLFCSKCGQATTSKVTKRRGKFTWVLCAMFCFWAPFCEWTKDTVHTCTICNTELGVRKKL